MPLIKNIFTAERFQPPSAIPQSSSLYFGCAETIRFFTAVYVTLTSQSFRTEHQGNMSESRISALATTHPQKSVNTISSRASFSSSGQESLSSSSGSQHSSRSLSNRLRTAARLEQRDFLNFGHMERVLKENRRGFRKNPSSPVELLSRKESKARSKAKKQAKLAAKSSVRGVGLGGEAPLPSRDRRREAGHGRSYQRSPASSSRVETLDSIVSMYCTDQDSRPRFSDAKWKVDEDSLREDNGYGADDAPSDDARSHGDYSYIYDLYME